jgi:serine O-acetyltransferase
MSPLGDGKSGADPPAPPSIRLPSLPARAQPPPGPDLSEVVEQLCQGNGVLIRQAKRVPCAEPLPSGEDLRRVVEGLRSVLFPGYFGNSEITPESLRFYLGNTLDWIRRELREQVKRGLCFACHDMERCGECDQEADDVVASFFSRLGHLQTLAASDVQAAYEGDPAATSPNEAIFCYPGIQAITNYRIAHALHKLKVPLLPRMITEQAHSATGIDIHPGARIDDALFIDHGTGVVVGETCIIGKRVRIYQGVTLGAKSFPLDKDGNPIKGIPRHPIIEDDVVIYSGATILGRVTIGRGAIIGGNVWLTRSVPAGARLTQQQPRQESFSRGGGI